MSKQLFLTGSDLADHLEAVASKVDPVEWRRADYYERCSFADRRFLEEEAVGKGLLPPRPDPLTREENSRRRLKLRSFVLKGKLDAALKHLEEMKEFDRLEKEAKEKELNE